MVNGKEAITKNLQIFFHKLSQAQGESEIEPIMGEMNLFIKNLDETQQKHANIEFTYYITKRLAHVDDILAKVETEIIKTNLENPKRKTSEIIISKNKLGKNQAQK